MTLQRRRCRVCQQDQGFLPVSKETEPQRNHNDAFKRFQEDHDARRRRRRQKPRRNFSPAHDHELRFHPVAAEGIVPTGPQPKGGESTTATPILARTSRVAPPGKPQTASAAPPAPPWPRPRTPAEPCAHRGRKPAAPQQQPHTRA